LKTLNTVYIEGTLANPMVHQVYIILASSI